MKKILVIASNTKMFFNFREDLVKEFISHGYKVSVIVPETGFKEQFLRLGAKEIVVSMNKNTISIFKNLSYLKRLKAVIKKENPNIVFSYTIKPIIFGSLAAHANKIENIYSMVTGLGHLYEKDVSFKTKIIRFICGNLYRFVFRYNKKIIFQNQDDINEVIKRHYVKIDKCALVSGSGVNMNKFKKTSLPSENVFIMVSRVLKSKGVMEYFEAAKMVKDIYPKTRFIYIGRIDKTSYAINYNDLKPYIDSNIVEYIPETDNVYKYLKLARIYVLPSYYREGIPRASLEALATGKAIITTDSIGCREVINGKNGLLVKPKDVNDLKEKMIYMIEHHKEVEKMGQESYNYCQERFDVSIVNKKMLEILEI